MTNFSKRIEKAERRDFELSRTIDTGGYQLMEKEVRRFLDNYKNEVIFGILDEAKVELESSPIDETRVQLSEFSMKMASERLRGIYLRRDKKRLSLWEASRAVIAPIYPIVCTPNMEANLNQINLLQPIATEPDPEKASENTQIAIENLFNATQDHNLFNLLIHTSCFPQNPGYGYAINLIGASYDSATGTYLIELLKGLLGYPRVQLITHTNQIERLLKDPNIPTLIVVKGECLLHADKQECRILMNLVTHDRRPLKLKAAPNGEIENYTNLLIFTQSDTDLPSDLDAVLRRIEVNTLTSLDLEPALREIEAHCLGGFLQHNIDAIQKLDSRQVKTEFDGLKRIETDPILPWLIDHHLKRIAPGNEDKRESIMSDALFNQYKLWASHSLNQNDYRVKSQVDFGRKIKKFLANSRIKIKDSKGVYRMGYELLSPKELQAAIQSEIGIDLPIEFEEKEPWRNHSSQVQALPPVEAIELATNRVDPNSDYAPHAENVE